VTAFLDLEDLLVITKTFRWGPVRDHGLLESAAHRPTTTVFGEDAYPDLHTKAAALFESLVRNHALVDGNKPLGWAATFMFYRLNGCLLDAPEGPAYDLVIATAEGRIDVAEIAATLAKWARPADTSSDE
jgi:death-on-curing protein